MARMLSALLQFKGKPTQDQTEAVSNLFTPPKTKDAVRILHYAWLSVLPDALGGGTYALLTTAYDEEFYKYIHDLVIGNPGPFNVAIAVLAGTDACIDPATHKPDVLKYLDQFIAFVKAHDLASPPRAEGAGYVAKGAYEAYDLTVRAIDKLQHPKGAA
jgi:hypothetical protein